MTYTDGWNDGFRQAREDLLEKLIDKAESTDNDDQGAALEWLITLLENDEI